MLTTLSVAMRENVVFSLKVSFGKIESEEKDEMKTSSGAKGQAKKTTKRFAHSNKEWMKVKKKERENETKK